MCYKCARREISLGFTNENVQEGQHICFIFNDENERRRIMSKYLESGLLANEKVLYLVDMMTPDEMIDVLDNLGVDVRSKLNGLTVSQAGPAYCPNGSFNADETLDLIRDFYHQAVHEHGFYGARGTGEMSWCLAEGRTDEEELMEYEARLNILLSKVPYTACCQYDARRFSGKMIMDVLNVHPMMIVRGQLVRNPFYIEPRIFLNEYRAHLRGVS